MNRLIEFKRIEPLINRHSGKMRQRRKNHLCKIMNRSELNDASHTVAKCDEDEPIERRCVVHFGQIRPRVHG